MRVVVLSNLKHDGVEYAPGQIAEIGRDEANVLIVDSIVKKATREDELVAEAKAKAAAEEAQAPQPEVETPGPEADANEPSKEWTRTKLDEFAVSKGIDPSNYTNKKELLKAIHRAP